MIKRCIVLLSLLALTNSEALAVGVRIEVRVVTIEDEVKRGLRSIVTLRHAGESKNYRTNADGIVEIEVAECDSNVSFFARPTDWQYKAKETDCTNNPLEIRAKRTRHATVIRKAFEADLSQYAAIAPELLTLQDELEKSARDGNFAIAAASANDIAAILRREGDRELADAFGAAAIEGGFRSDAFESWGSSIENYLVRDNAQGRWVMTPSGQSDLLRFQGDAEIEKTGQWDWKSFDKLQAFEAMRARPIQ